MVVLVFVTATMTSFTGEPFSPRGLFTDHTVYWPFSKYVNASLSAPRAQLIAGLYSVIPEIAPATLVSW